MKPEEMMLGDWVEFTSKYGYGKGQIAGIEPREGSAEPTTFTIIKMDEQGNTRLYVGVSKVCVRPIPLTAEILEKNGFGYRSLGGAEEWFIADDYYDIVVHEWSDSIWVFKYESTEMNTPHEQRVFGYVHNLQHALRENGIDKEIVL